jgi:LmbE family N-acetylglucosaminyl deacetylase
MRKQQLLKRHRRMKRLGVLVAFILPLIAAVLYGPWQALAVVFLGWIAHEAWFSDHLFYNPRIDYRYRFDDAVAALPAQLENDRLSITGELAERDTLFLQVRLRATWLGRFLEPGVWIESSTDEDRQSFELGVSGLRYLNLTGLARALAVGEVRLRGRHCRIDLANDDDLKLLRARHPDYRQQRVMVIAPHADDAELAAFGLYSQAREAWIVTLTAGEIETEHYRRMGLDGVAAARLKGRLRAWDALAAPLWGGVSATHCATLGYFCMQLGAMRESTAKAIPSREADLTDIRPFRQGNALTLPGDADGRPTWENLLADLRELVRKTRPEVIVLPHPHFDPHTDHIAAYAAVREVLQDLDWQPQTLLCYAHHLHDNDIWPMGESHTGVPLPPLAGDAAAADSASLLPWSLPLARATQIDKAMALDLMHDLRPSLLCKRRLRRFLQTLLTGRRWPRYGENEFFRKAVRRHELFWVERLESGDRKN